MDAPSALRGRAAAAAGENRKGCAHERDRLEGSDRSAGRGQRGMRSFMPAFARDAANQHARPLGAAGAGIMIGSGQLYIAVVFLVVSNA